MWSGVGEHRRRNEPNRSLAAMLDELGWSPRDLSQHLNEALGEYGVSPTAPYHWRDHGGVPRSPLAQLTAQLLSHHLRRHVSCEHLWGRPFPALANAVTADHGFADPMDRNTTLQIIREWGASGPDRRTILAISGQALIGLATTLTTKRPPMYATAGRAARSGGPLLDQIESTVPLLQRLDDAEGGGRYLPYVEAHLQAIALALRDGGHSTSTELGLLTALADVGQLAGWMAFDAGQHGRAQRHYLTALRIAHQAGYQSMTAHILGDLAFQAATRGHAADAVALGEHARDAAAHSAPAVRASVCSRHGYGYAIAGQMDDFERAYRDGLDALTSSTGPHDPAWMYFLTAEHLHAQAGYALIHAALTPGARQPADPALLHRGQQLLHPGAHDYPIGDPSERRALFEGAWLAVAAAHLGDYETASHHGQTAIRRLHHVRSRRSSTVLAQLAHRLRKAKRNPYARDFLPDLEIALRSQRAT